MAKAGFLACAHTCKHPSPAECLSISRRRPFYLRSCFIYPTTNKTQLKKHVDIAKFHPECTVDCPAYEGHPESSRVWSRELNEGEWIEWAVELECSFPSLARHIPAKYLEDDEKTVCENKSFATCHDGDKHREGIQSDKQDEDEEDEDEENADEDEEEEEEEEGMQVDQGERVLLDATSNPSVDSGQNSSDTPSKRKRASDAAASPIPSPKRAKTAELQRSKHWEIDGTVIIQVDDFSFKLQKSRLAKLSTWFRETFEKLGILNDAKEHDTPINVDVPSFSVHDFEVMLDAADSFVTYYYNPPEFETVASILRVSTALSFTDFKTWSTEFLEQMWPPELARLSATPIPFAWETVVLARECSVPYVLKRALYELVRTEGLGQDFELDEGGINDRRLLLKAREKLTSVWIAAAASLPYKFTGCFSESQEERAACATRQSKLLNRAHAKLIPVFEQYKWDPVCGFKALMKMPWKDMGFCEKCVGWRWKTWEREQKRCWDNLDVWFELSEGDEI